MTYWGNVGAGILFFCNDEILLTLRSQHILQPGTWSLPGGSIRGEYHTDEERIKPVQLTEKEIWAGAKKETREELGSFPRLISPFDKVIYRDKGFEFTTFLVKIPEFVKNMWEFEPDSFEVEDVRWFPRYDLPLPLHFGMIYVMQRKPQYFF